MPSAVGVDVGGTFTDVVVVGDRGVVGWKAPTTPDQADGVVAALGGVGPEAIFLHGTTAGTNALLEERGARVVLVTTAGFEDVIEIGRQARPSLYDPFHDRPMVLVDRERRVGYDAEHGDVVAAIRAHAPEAVAVALVRSYREPGEELELGARLAEASGLPVSVGARVSPEFREYERVATTVLNAYLTPEVAGYLRRLDESVPAARRLVMTSSGGLLPFGTAVDMAGRLVLSGPAAGVIGASAMGEAHGHASMITFDMGGTSTDVCRVSRGTPVGGRRQTGPGDRVNRVPGFPIRTIGAGGGSVGWVDDGGALRVGPRSAGAHPGPACYRQGGVEATVTDANLLLGRIPPSLALGGSLTLDPAAAVEALGRLGEALALTPSTTAEGVVEVVDAHMERALRSVSVEEGFDPRGAVLVAFGGAGGLHASRLARRLGIRTTLVPPLSGVFSALGLLLARPSSDTARTVLLDEGHPRLARSISEVAAEARRLYAEHDDGGDPEVEVVAEMRYRGQSHELAVTGDGEWPALRASFEREHLTRFGFIREGEPVELVNVRATARGTAPLTWSDLPRVEPRPTPRPVPTTARIGEVEVEVPMWAREALPAGFETRGPAVVVERDSAVWLDPEDRLGVHDDGALEITS